MVMRKERIMRKNVKELLEPLANWFEAYPSWNVEPLNFQFAIEDATILDAVTLWVGQSGFEDIIVPFGWRGDGDLCAFWFLQDCPPEQTPIVLLWMEEDREFSILANTYNEFLALVSSGYKHFDDESSLLPDSPELSKFRKWVLMQGVESIPDFNGVNTILEKAQAQYLHFEQYLEEIAG
jgi:hypothetical protein